MKKLFLILLLGVIISGCNLFNENKFVDVKYDSKKSEDFKNFRAVNKGVIVFYKDKKTTKELVDNINKFNTNDIKFFMMKAPGYSELYNVINNNVVGSINYLKDGQVIYSEVLTNDYNPEAVRLNIKRYLEDGIKLNEKDIMGFDNIIDLTKLKPQNNSSYFSFIENNDYLHQDSNLRYIESFNNKNYETNCLNEPSGLNDQLNVLGKNVNEDYSHNLVNNLKDKDSELKIINNGREIVVNNKEDKVFWYKGKKTQKFELLDDNDTRYTIIKSISRQPNESFYFIIDKLNHRVYKSNSLIFENSKQIYFYNKYGLGALDKDDDNFYLLTKYNNNDMNNLSMNELKLVGNTLHHSMKGNLGTFEYHYTIPHLQKGLVDSKKSANYFESYIDIKVKQISNIDDYDINECLDLGFTYQNDKVCTLKSKGQQNDISEFLGFFNENNKIYGIIELNNERQYNLRLLKSGELNFSFLINYGLNIEVLNIEQIIFDKELFVLHIIKDIDKNTDVYEI